MTSPNGGDARAVRNAWSNKGSVTKLLLLTCSTMPDVDGGTVLFRALVPFVPEGRLVWAVAGGATSTVPAWASHLERCVVVSQLFSRWVAGLSRRSPLRRLWCSAAYGWFPRYAARQIARFAAEHKVQRVWMHAGSSAIHTAIELRRLMGLPLHISVQDDVEGHVGRVEGAYLREGLKTLLRTADSADLTSSGMLDYYRDRYDLPTRTEVLITGGDGGPLPASPEVRPTLTRIGFAGNLWASDAMRVLLGALERLNRRR